ncbi:aldehyde dehydrogenase (NADP(+)) [Ferrimonas balearica]|uniref:aldehyde dehydrogenase (NADP(+)) n=1 Tax=Ferrimonas balearica TaxID=44012 RepID=UPI001C996866|nr:aldehyde dehydrogenase (NADP(+)) [Ferrimonas balearica]MBY5922326.1 aldehyde dehydrogenase (NADP(+)) [Ferrimonas balearica]MBY5994334.1 aldehyde dehydrogenase (NADP(+)) [Ferrimonas balearica]
MPLTGQHFIAGQWTGLPQHDFLAWDPRTDAPLPTHFADGSEAEVAAAASAAADAFAPYRRLDTEQRAAYLEAIAEEIEALGDELLNRAEQETALPAARLQGERGRTCGQLRAFAGWLRSPLHPVIKDAALPDRQPLPRPDIRLGQVPLGPVAVFGASNFPLAFSVAGGDTASALAAGCPVIVKGHPAHPGTSELVAGAIGRAISRCNLPAGVFSLIQGRSPALSVALVRHPVIAAVGFTGSGPVGQALAKEAANRPRPIPFYGELGAVNPQVILPGQLAAQPEQLAEMQIGSMMMGQGQFCTSPGLVLLPNSEGADRYLASLAEGLSSQTEGVMLTPGIARAYRSGADHLASQNGVTELARGRNEGNPNGAVPLIYRVSADDALGNAALFEEVFGPCVLVITGAQGPALDALVDTLPGQLTCTIHGTADDFARHEALLEALAYTSGRLIANQMPTGVEVCAAQNHGGPWPASTAAQTTSVGAEAIQRFLRPLAYQNWPTAQLPQALR